MPDTAVPLRVARLRTRAASDDAPRVRLAAEALVGGIDPALPGLAPQAVLLVRRLALAWPADALRRWTDPRTGRVFAAQAEAAIAAAAHRARRPLLEAVPDDADAVLFGDEAELLACLARDAAAGRLQRWWWRRWLGAAHPFWPQAFAERPRAAQAARRWLVAWGLDEWVRHAGCRTGSDAAPTAPRATTGGPWPVLEDRAGGPGRPDTRTSPVAKPRAPAGSVAPPRPAPAGLESPPTTHPPGQTTAAPAEPGEVAPAGPHPVAEAAAAPAATTATAGALAGSTPSRTADAVDGPPRGPSEEAGPGLDRTIQPADERSRPPRRSGSGSGGGPNLVPATGPGRAGRRTRRWAAALHRARGGAGPGAGARPASRHAGHVGASIAERADDGIAIRSPLPTDGAPRNDAAIDVARPVGTAWGGVFFLVNALVARGWVADFTQPAGAGLALSPWALLAAVARTLAGAALRRDPLWPLLWALAERPPGPAPRRRPGRARSRPAADPVAARRARRATTASPALSAFRATPAHRPARRGTGGFAWPGACAASGGRAATSRGRSTPSPSRPSPAAASPDPAHAIERLARSLRELLARALGVTPAELVATLLRQPAEVWTSAGQVSVVFDLARHPVAVRLAGLDRDPGWLPGAGRRLQFFFR